MDHPELTVALALAFGIMAQSVSRLLRLPGIVLLLACGALLGPEGVGWIQPKALARASSASSNSGSRSSCSRAGSTSSGLG